MVLPGHTATVVRQQFGKIIKRHFGGDQSLHAEIDANATSNSPIAQMARESLGMAGGDKPALVGLKRRREELELLKLEHERVSSLMTDYEKMCTNTTLDEQAKTAFKAMYLNLLNTKTAPLATQKQIKPTIDPAQEIFKRFLSTLGETSAIVTKFAARELYKQYTDYLTTTGHHKDLVMTETAFGREIKHIPGVSKKKARGSNFYTLDHAAIKQSLATH